VLLSLCLFFWTDVVLDPNYSILLGGSKTESAEKNLNTVIYIAVGVCAGVALAICLAFFLQYYIHQQRSLAGIRKVLRRRRGMTERELMERHSARSSVSSISSQSFEI